LATLKLDWKTTHNEIFCSQVMFTWVFFYNFLQTSHHISSSSDIYLLGKEVHKDVSHNKYLNS